MSDQALDPSAAATRGPRPGLSLNGLVLITATVGLGGLLAVTLKPPVFLPALFIVCAWVTTVAVHEFCHALAAYRAGDHTVAIKGYLSFDPLKYADLGTSLILPVIVLALGGIGFPGGAVYLRDDLMRNRWGRAFASLAGPLGTLVCLLVLVAGFHAASGAGLMPLAAALAFLTFLQATGLVINLLPIPGLDGFGVIRPFLSPATQQAANRIGGLVGLALMAAIFLLPGASSFIFGVGVAITDLVGLPRLAIADGWRAFTFWR